MRIFVIGELEELFLSLKDVLPEHIIGRIPNCTALTFYDEDAWPDAVVIDMRNLDSEDFLKGMTNDEWGLYNTLTRVAIVSNSEAYHNFGTRLAHACFSQSLDTMVVAVEIQRLLQRREKYRRKL